MTERHRFVVSCEHGGNQVPDRHRRLFASDAARAALDGHRGWDLGAAPLARALARELHAPLVTQSVTRLLVECNRSADHRALWSEFSRALSDVEKARVLDQYWRPHRDAVRARVEAAPPGAVVVHLGVHTFTPIWNGRPRSTDIGLLFDPRHTLERRIAVDWREALLRSLRPPLPRIHFNRPYRGWTDGLTTTLRAELSEERYAGFEIEVSQRLMPLPHECIARIAGSLESSLR